VAASTLLINPAWVDRAAFTGVTFIEIDPSEAYAANVLPLGGRVLCSGSFPRTRERLVRAGLDTLSLESDELAKAEGALTCCSLILTL
jgi:dimethylargininase